MRDIERTVTDISTPSQTKEEDNPMQSSQRSDKDTPKQEIISSAEANSLIHTTKSDSINESTEI